MGRAKSEAKSLAAWPPETEDSTDSCESGGPDRSPLLEAIKGATTSDLNAIRARIDECEKELDALKMAEKMIDVRLNGKRERQPRSTVANLGGATDLEDLANKVFDLITREGPGRPAQIAIKLGAKPISVGKAISKMGEWFRRDSEGKVHIAMSSGKLKSGDDD